MQKIILFLFISISLYASSNNIYGKLIKLGNQPGPHGETIIMKYYDKSLNVMCYMYVPNYIATTYNGNMTFIKGFAGNISCVQLSALNK